MTETSASTRWALDADMLRQPRRPLWIAGATVLAATAVVACGYAVRLTLHPHGWALTVTNGALLVAGYGALSVWAAFVYRSVKKSHGYPPFVVQPLRRSALKVFGLAFLAEFAARFIVLALLFAAHPAWRSHTPGNVHLRGHSAAYITEAALVAICVAPAVEEVLFRGIILQTLTQWWGFWPAAVTSSLAFGLLHAYEAPNAASAILLVANISVFGLGQAVVTRYTGNLSIPIALHSFTNAVAVLFNLL